MSVDQPFDPPCVSPCGPAAQDDWPILEEADLFVPDPVWMLSEPEAVLAEMQSLLASGVYGLLRPQDGCDLIAQPVSIDATNRQIEWRLSGAPGLAQALQTACRVSVRATLGRIDLMFDVAGFSVSPSDPSTLRCVLPDCVRRVQRRDAYRLRMRAYSRGGPRVQFRWGDMRETVQVRMLDLSRGGCGVLLPEGFQARTLPVGTNLRSVKVDLSGNLVFMMSAKVIWTTMVRDKDTLECRLRAGLAWVAIAPANARSIQQYLDDVQRQRRMLMKG